MALQKFDYCYYYKTKKKVVVMCGCGFERMEMFAQS